MAVATAITAAREDLGRLRQAGDAPIEQGLALAVRGASFACGPRTPTDDAIVAIGALHDVESK